jgi:hypothetical protein
MYGGVPGGEPVADYGADADAPDKQITDINDLIHDDDPPFDPDDDE